MHLNIMILKYNDLKNVKLFLFSHQITLIITLRIYTKIDIYFVKNHL